MTNSASSLSGILNSPIRILATILVIVFVVEAVVMYTLTSLIGEALGELGTTFVDTCLLTLICAPLLWMIIIGPLRRIAVQEQQRSETIVSNAGEAIVTLDSQSMILSANQAAVDLFGAGFNELLSGPIQRFVPNWPTNLTQTTSDLRLEARSVAGRSIPVQVSFSAYSSDARNLWIAIIHDLTAAQQAEQERISAARQTEALRAQQMATLAQLATGVAHEIRNPLTSIKMLIQLNQSKLTEQGLSSDDLNLVESEIRKMERSVTHLLDFARPESAEFFDFPLQEAINRTSHLVAGRCRSQQVQLMVAQPEPLINIHGDCTQIQQLLLNLCLNALDAMPTGGTISILVEPVSLDPNPSLSIAESFHAERVSISVSDTGTGIEIAKLPYLFEPFFTTKANGVGLGLGICKRIAESHHGTLTAANRSQGGAVFELKLPIQRVHFQQNAIRPIGAPLSSTPQFGRPLQSNHSAEISTEK